jgi:exonuclease SbcC
MKPELLTLKNIGPFSGSHTIDFSGLGDIFLVCGKTGAGKTTIFDAISYAFYGEAPGSRKGLARAMRSQFASEGEESAVALEFSLAGKRYRIRRTLAGERIGSRSGKVQNVAEEVTFELFAGNFWEDRSSTNKSETDRKILDLIGLSADEFSRIVILPQGEFAQFLRQNSSERKEVLAKLFPIEKYGRVIELARNRAREAVLAQKETESALVDLETRFNRLSYDTDRAALESEIGRLRAEQATARKLVGEKSGELEKARAQAERRLQAQSLDRAIAELESALPETDDKKNRLDSARRASPLTENLARIAETRERIATQGKALGDIEREMAEKKREIAELENERSRINAELMERESLLVRKERLRIAVDIAETLEADIAEADKTAKQLAAKKKELANLKGNRETRAKRLAALEGEASRFDERNRENARVREELELKRQLKILADEYERERKAIATHEATVAAAKTAIAENTRDIGIAKAELADLEATAERARDCEQASTLALKLEDGKPCPVCGSTTHPAPAKPSATAGYSLTERMEAGKRRCELLDKRTAELAGELAARQANLRNAEERRAVIIQKYCAGDTQCILPENIPTPDEATRRVQEASRAMQEQSDALTRSRNAWRESEELRKQSEKEEAEFSQLTADIAELDRAAAEQKADIGNKRKRYMEAFPSGGQEGGEPVPDPADAKDALEECSARLLTIDADAANFENALKEAQTRLSALTGKKTEVERSLAELGTSEKTASATFALECAKAGFSDEIAVRRSFMDMASQKALEEEITRFAERLAEARTKRAALEAELARWTGPAPEAVAEEIERLDERIAATSRALEEKNAGLAALDALKERWDALEKERAERSIEGSRLAALANDLTGNNPAKVSFDAWILGMYLEEITAYANARLERMSEGRYRIQLNGNYRKGNALSGLELEILDAYTGKTRPSGTLSGGETFMASISLALGLADSIQSRSGGIQLDAVFLDEGFGTLDEASLERAITILDEIRGSRMVGIISHVAELRSRIPNRIEVVKTGAGSSIRKEISL